MLAGKEYDLIYDCVGDAEDWKKAAKVLKKGGKFVTIANFGENAPIDGRGGRRPQCRICHGPISAAEAYVQ